MCVRDRVDTFLGKGGMGGGGVPEPPLVSFLFILCLLTGKCLYIFKLEVAG